MAKRKSSARVTLALIGVAAFAAACDRAEEQRRDVYATREDCLADWGNKPQDCTPATDPDYRSRHFFYGPSYIYHSGGSGSTWVHTPRALGSTSTHPARGGFGASGRSGGG